jgi:ATP synthase protein I
MEDFKKISARLEIAKKKIKKNLKKSDSTNVTSLGKAFKISTELVASVVVGATLGYILDNWFGTKPWLIICFFFMGVAAGILNVIRSAKNMHRNLKK